MNLIENKEQELREKLETCHLLYLQIEERFHKLEKRSKLEDIIEEYLSLVTHDRKFIFQETSEIFFQSALTLPDFNGFKAAWGWTAISYYASNLFSQPWRKEYKNIKTFSGFYKHEVEANLANPEIMFVHMGYTMCNNGVLILNGPIDPDKVSYVSRDAIVALVECKILKRIYEEVSKNFNISWLEILEFRKHYVGPADQAIRALYCRHVEYSENALFSDPQIPNIRYYQSNPPIRQLHDGVQKLSLRENKNNNYSPRNNFDDNLLQDYKQANDLIPSVLNDFSTSYLNSDVSMNMRLVEPVLCESQPFQVRDTDYPSNSKINNSHQSTDKINLLYRIDSGEFPQELINEEPTFIQGSECIPTIADIPQNNLLFNDQLVNKYNVKEAEPILDRFETDNDERVWSCYHCTFLNTEDVKICQMCDKTQKLSMGEPCISDGKPCPKCTLLNSKISSKCDACGSDI